MLPARDDASSGGSPLPLDDLTSGCLRCLYSRDARVYTMRRVLFEVGISKINSCRYGA